MAARSLSCARFQPNKEIIMITLIIATQLIATLVILTVGLTD